MIRSALLLTSLMIAGCPSTFAQAVQNTDINRNINKPAYIRFNYGNDYFTATDYYNTQNILLEFVSPSLAKIPLYKIFYRPSGTELRYGLAGEHNGYTPVYYEREDIQYNDRPFAGSLALKTFVIATNTVHKYRLSSALSTGIVGQGAGTKQMQIFIHENTNNTLPRGWDNQIRNDIVLNYEVVYQKQLFAIDHVLSVTADAAARLGTLNTKANIGCTIMAGYFRNPFASLNLKGRSIQFYAYDHPEMNLIGYDATLQGGLFNRKSPYTIPSSSVNRLVFRNNWGLVARIGLLYLEYYQSFMTREFAAGMEFRNGGIQIGFAL